MSNIFETLKTILKILFIFCALSQSLTSFLLVSLKNALALQSYLDNDHFVALKLGQHLSYSKIEL